MGARYWARRLLSRHSGILPSSPARARVQWQRRGGCNAMAVALWQWRVETELRVRERAGTRMPARERDKGEQQKRRNGTGTGTAAREERERNLLALLPAVPLSSPRSCSLVAILGSLPRRRGYRLQGEEKEHRARYTIFFQSENNTKYTTIQAAAWPVRGCRAIFFLLVPSNYL